MSIPTSQKPPPPKKPGQVKVFRALYDFTSQRDDQLSFSEGDLIYIIDMITSKDWYKAKCNSKIGLVPSNYSINYIIKKTMRCVQEKKYFTRGVFFSLGRAIQGVKVDFCKYS